MAPLIPTRLAGLTGAARSGAAGLLGAGAGAAAQFLTFVLVTRGVDQETAGVFFSATALCLAVATVLRLDAGKRACLLHRQVPSVRLPLHLRLRPRGARTGRVTLAGGRLRDHPQHLRPRAAGAGDGPARGECWASW